jgi:hypothetical protein
MEGMATKRKKIQNLEVPGMKSSNPFAILNDIEDVCLIQAARELDIKLASDEEGEKLQISTIKAEELLRQPKKLTWKT